MPVTAIMEPTNAIENPSDESNLDRIYSLQENKRVACATAKQLFSHYSMNDKICSESGRSRSSHRLTIDQWIPRTGRCEWK
ncbi:hypothetical protein ABTM48_20400, partial [Acinetobacter baumannii]